jgi:hypothetical protein
MKEITTEKRERNNHVAITSLHLLIINAEAQSKYKDVYIRRLTLCCLLGYKAAQCGVTGTYHFYSYLRVEE